MNAYFLLFFAILAEIAATSALKVADGFTKLIPSLIVVCGYGTAFYLMSLSLKTLPVSVVYAIWSGLGIVGITIIGIFYFKEMFGWWHFIGISFIMVGIFILQLVTKTH